MPSARTVVNLVSLSRVAFGLVFVVCFQRRTVLLAVSLGICIAAFATDRLDGYLARKLNVASVYGRLWDSLGDKAFYCATIVAFNAQAFLDPLISWALIVREVALYITRILYIDNLPKIEQNRPLTKLHGYCMCLTILLGLFRMYAITEHVAIEVYPYMQVTAFAAFIFGMGSLIHYLRIR